MEKALFVSEDILVKTVNLAWSIAKNSTWMGNEYHFVFEHKITEIFGGTEMKFTYDTENEIWVLEHLPQIES